MKKSRNISLLGLLMVSSQILLALFLAYWLFNQYNSSKELLIKDLERGFHSAEQESVDSALSSQIIDPFLKDSSNYTVFMMDPLHHDSGHMKQEFYYHEDSIPQMRVVVSGSEMQVSKSEGEKPQLSKFGISVVDSIYAHESNTLISQSLHDSSDQILLQSVKLFIKSIGGTTNSEHGISLAINADIDSLLFMQTYQGFLDSYFPEFKAEWRFDPMETEADSATKDIVFTSYLFGKGLRVEINKYQMFLLKSMAAQIGFATLLLLITGLAFRLAFVNLRNQQRLMEIKNDFISNITHELKTPVSTVKVALEALLDFNMKDDPQRTKEYLEMAHNEMNRLDLLVNQVLTNSSMEDNHEFILMEPTDLNHLIDEVLLSMHTRFDLEQAEVGFIKGQDPHIVHVDKLHLFGLLVNLVDNSLKYAITKPKIEIRTSVVGKKTIVSVSDNGPGIPSEYTDKIFDKFFRVPQGDSHNVKGYGLGLNYAALVMAQHHGNIVVKNNLNGGCTFILNLPNV